ncbi:hypothetical protein D9758_012414 [Tetrapyrgos nigripes]|uniref:IRG-type G domain-containing protein n=1 Tax=Tetrapyrgos nigripes TaxID=182062 RepID=A0A8H5D792_9AGAR|nr:hypothetical protein D9758_012414 [Tetrapyrgos nigripes]
MGAALSVIVPACAAIAPLVARLLTGQPNQNPALNAIENHHRMEDLEKRLKETEEAIHKANDEAAEAKEMLRKALATGPLSWPTKEDYAQTLKDRQYQEGNFHFAIAGQSGSGKSSLVNAFRGVLDGNMSMLRLLGLDSSGINAAAIGIAETTGVIGRYPDPIRPKLVWYDIPGAGTLRIENSQYFNKQGLYVFDAIIVVFDNRFTSTDIAILRDCARWNIRSFIVRSKSDLQLQNLENGLKAAIDEKVADEDERQVRRGKVRSIALEGYVTETQRSVKENLLEAGLQDQKVYLVSSANVRSISKGEAKMDSATYLDEGDLINDILEATVDRRFPMGSQRSPPV